MWLCQSLDVMSRDTTTLGYRRACDVRVGKAKPGGGGAVASVTDLAVDFTRAGQVVHALRGVSLQVGASEVLAVVGESGSGKSVLGLALLGLLGRDATITGSVRVCGTEMTTAAEEDRRLVRRDKLGAVFQDPMTSLNPSMRVGRQLVEATGSVEEAVRLLDLTGVPDPARRLRLYPHELSGGLRQRVMIAMAVAGSPRLVVADEATTALDVTVQAQILDLLATLRAELHTSFVFVTHDLGVAGCLADRTAVLYGGRVVEVGPTAEVLGAPAHHYTRGLLSARLPLRSRGRSWGLLGGSPVDPRSEAPGCLFAPRCPAASAQCSTVVPEVEFLRQGRQVACLHPLGAKAEAPNRVEEASKAVEARDAHVPHSLVLRGVECDFKVKGGRLAALRGVDLKVAAGESVAIVGESGCGKSTLLRVAAGLARPSAGTVEIAEGSRPQMVFQDAGASLTPWLTVGELLEDRLRGGDLTAAERRMAVKDSLERVGLPGDVAGARARQLSGGQRQRVALARATIIPPSLLLCDEPTSALDVSLAATVLALLAQLRRELGMSMVFVTHDLAVARAVADRIVVMYLGRVVEQGPVDELIDGARHPYTRALLASVPELGTLPRPLGGEPANPLAVPTGCEFRPRCPASDERCGRRPALAAAGPSASVACWQRELVSIGAGRVANGDR